MKPLKIYLIGSGVCAIMVVAFFLFIRGEKEDDLQMLAAFPDEVSVEETVESAEAEVNLVIKVDVKGAVARPGLYVATDGDRVQDVIEQAGSFTEKADQNAVNLAQRVEDQMVIYVPEIGEEVSPVNVPSTGGGASNVNQQDGKININKASASELETITGIGPSKANAILQYREENGAFKSIEELKNISGIGEKTFEKLQDEVSI